jgi:phosphatidylserine/phosphatidylglycerophosphate/cardiolipin synthase-like enzyme
MLSKPALVKEAARLFDCDSKRQPFTHPRADLVVSPVNARKSLTDFVAGARKQLLMYQMKISDREFLKLLNRKIAEGVEVRVLSRAAAKNGGLPMRKLPTRLHLRAILRDGSSAFLGSQSLSKVELEARREIGVIFRDKKIVRQMEAVFETDWKASEPAAAPEAAVNAFNIPAKKVAKEVAKQMAIKPMMEQMLDKFMDSKGDGPIEPEEMAQTVRDTFRDEVHGAVETVMQEMASKSTQKDEKRSAGNGKG